MVFRTSSLVLAGLLVAGTVAARSGGGWIEVRDGLKEGDAVVVAGKAALREGSAVQVLGDRKAAVDKPAVDKPAADKPAPAETAKAGN